MVWNSFGVNVIYIYVLYIVRSPYLLVFGDDHVRDTWEHMMLQVDLVRHTVRAGITWAEAFWIFITIVFYGFE